MRCSNCGEQIRFFGEFCPFCNALKRAFKWQLAICIVLSVFLIVYCAFAFNAFGFFGPRRFSIPAAVFAAIVVGVNVVRAFRR